MKRTASATLVLLGGAAAARAPIVIPILMIPA